MAAARGPWRWLTRHRRPFPRDPRGRCRSRSRRSCGRTAPNGTRWHAGAAPPAARLPSLRVRPRFACCYLDHTAPAARARREAAERERVGVGPHEQ
jgi:hypothetical protein